MAWSLETSNGFESRKIKYLLPKYTRGRVLEIGCGMEKAFPHFIGYDSGHHFGKGGADIVGDAASLSLFADESFDAVFSSHVLEHMEDMQEAINEWSRVIKPGGFLCLYVPSANLYPKCGEPGANPDHKHDVYPGDIITMLDDSPYWFRQHECQERADADEYSLFEVYEKLKADDGTDADCVTIPKKPRVKGQKHACVVRYGGFGDMLQTASILPGLKKQGYHVTVMTTPNGQHILQHDPHIDDWYIQDKDQVPNNELHAFWTEQAKRFDRFINLSESIEGTLLALPGRPNHAWPHEVRHKQLNRNYFEWTAELAGVDFKPPHRLFYPAEQEIVDACKLCDSKGYTILWALSGSSHHKFSPHMDAVIARIMLDMPDAQVILVGDDACQVLEAGWENEPRVVCLSGKLSIRQTLALAQRSDMVIGPETGVLNCVAHEPNAKIIMLSHSSVNNLSKHWYNTQSLAPVNTPCYPCHWMHYDRSYCPGDPITGAAYCMQNISAAAIWNAVETGRKGKKK